MVYVKQHTHVYCIYNIHVEMASTTSKKTNNLGISINYVRDNILNIINVHVYRSIAI